MPGDRDAPSDGWCDGTAQAPAQLDAVAPHDAVAYHVAAVRETFEEAGILLARDLSGNSSGSTMPSCTSGSHVIAATCTPARDRCAR